LGDNAFFLVGGLASSEDLFGETARSGKPDRSAAGQSPDLVATRIPNHRPAAFVFGSDKYPAADKTFKSAKSAKYVIVRNLGFNLV